MYVYLTRWSVRVWDGYAAGINEFLRINYGLPVLDRGPFDPILLTAIAVFAFLPQLPHGLLAQVAASLARHRSALTCVQGGSRRLACVADRTGRVLCDRIAGLTWDGVTQLSPWNPRAASGGAVGISLVRRLPARVRTP